MRPGKDIANEFVVMAKMNRLMVNLDGNSANRILLYIADRYPYQFEKAIKHLRANGWFPEKSA